MYVHISIYIYEEIYMEIYMYRIKKRVNLSKG